MRRIPLVSLQNEIYRILNEFQTTPIYNDDIPSTATAPYLTLGRFTCRANGTKVNDITDCSIQVNIWSSHQGNKELNEIAHDVISVLSNVDIDLSKDHFKILKKQVFMFESSNKDKDGYHGVITLSFKIENIGG